MSADLFGTTSTPGRPGRSRRAYRVQLTGIGPERGRAEQVRVQLVDADTGAVIGAQALPFSWLQDVAYPGGTCAVTIDTGVWT